MVSIQRWPTHSKLGAPEGDGVFTTLRDGISAQNRNEGAKPGSAVGVNMSEHLPGPSLPGHHLRLLSLQKPPFRRPVGGCW